MARSKGQGSIALRKDGVYMGRITRNGITKTFYSKDRKKVENELFNYSHMCQVDFEKKVVRVRFQQYMYDYLFTYKYGHIKDTSFDRLERVYRVHIMDSAIGVIPLCELDDISIQQFLNSKYDSNLSLSQCKKIYDLIRSVLFYAYKKNDLSVDYGSLLRFPSADHFKEVKRIEIYTAEECQKMKTLILNPVSQRDKRFLRYAPAFLIMLNTGLRAGEMLCLTWDDIDFKNKVIHVTKTLSFICDRENSTDKETHYKNVVSKPKTLNSIRDIPMNDTVVSLFSALQENYREYGCLDNYVVCNVNGEFIRLRSLEAKLKRICETCGIKYKGVHALRHTFASRLIESGVSPKVVSDLLGHANVAFTLNRYVHPDESNKYEAVKCLESV